MLSGVCFSRLRPPPGSTLFPYPTLFRSPWWRVEGPVTAPLAERPALKPSPKPVTRTRDHGMAPPTSPNQVPGAVSAWYFGRVTGTFAVERTTRGLCVCVCVWRRRWCGWRCGESACGDEMLDRHWLAHTLSAHAQTHSHTLLFRCRCGKRVKT